MSGTTPEHPRSVPDRPGGAWKHPGTISARFRLDFYSILEVWEVNLVVPFTTYLIGNAFALSRGDGLVDLRVSSRTCHDMLDWKRFRLFMW